MSTKKKRNKKYTGPGAKDTQDLVRIHKSVAVVRSDRAQWIFDHKKIIRTVSIAALVIILLVALIIGFLMN